MSETRRRAVVAVAVMAGMLLLTPLWSSVDAAEPAWAASVPATDPPGTPETDPPEETVPPETSEPDTTAPGDTGTDRTDESGDDAVVATIAVVGFTLLLFVAAWWMVRLRSVDDEDYPPRPRIEPDGPLPGQDLI